MIFFDNFFQEGKAYATFNRETYKTGDKKIDYNA